MPATFDARRLRHQRAMDTRLTAELRQLARSIASLVMRAGTARDVTGQPTIPPARTARDNLKTAIWEQVLKPYFVGPGTDALKGPTPQSPYAKLLVEGITQATRIQAERQAAILRRVCKDETVVQWLTGPRPFGSVREMEDTGTHRNSIPIIPIHSYAGRITELLSPSPATVGSLRRADGRIDTARARAALVKPAGMYEPFHHFVDPNGYRLSDRIWRTSIDVRSRIDRLMDYEIAQGTSAVDIAGLIEPFLTPGGLQARTQKPYGSEGSYSARRLARTEITAAAGRATINAATANPFVEQLQWRISGSHPKPDECDDNAHGGPNGDGIYPIDQVPSYPSHPMCVTPGQLVQTARGNVPIEDIRQGDLVQTHLGRYRRVLAAWATPHDGQVYTFETERGSFELTGNHPVLTRRGWVNAENMQLGDQVLYASVNVTANGSTAVTEGDPAERGESIIPQVVTSWASVMPASSIAFDGDLVFGKGEIDHEGADAKLFDIGNLVPSQSIGHSDLQLCARRMATGALHGTEPLIVVTLLDSERLATMFADDDNAIFEGQTPRMCLELNKARITSFLGLGNFAGNVGTLGGVAVASGVEMGIDVAKQGASRGATRPVVFLPTGAGSIPDVPHGDIVQGEQVAKNAKGDAVLLEDMGTGKPLLNVDVMQQVGNGALVFSFEAQGVEIDGRQVVGGEMATSLLHMQATDGASNHDNLLSLSPDDSVGRESGNSLVGGVITPSQALPNYTAVQAIRLRHYSGPVYNMEVADDHTYTVNGVAVHNCLCSLLPVPSGSTADLVTSLRADIQAAKGKLVDAVGKGNPERALALQGILNPDYLTQAILSGNLDEAVAQAVTQAGAVPVGVATKAVAPALQPVGTPVSGALQIPQSGKYSALYQETLNAIDAVHGDGALPDLPVVTKSNMDALGHYRYYQGTGKPIEIAVNGKGDHHQLTLTHEVGHFLDYQAIGRVGTAASTQTGVMDGWRDAVANSAAVKRLRQKRMNPSGFAVEQTFPSGRTYVAKPDAMYLIYATDEKELWARSYAQYVATKSGNLNMLAQVEKERLDPIYGERQWSDDDFAPIAAAIDALFRGLGWLR